jgi:hypothetical protein
MLEVLLTIQALVKLAEVLQTQQRDELTDEEMELVREARKRANQLADAAGI